MKKILVTIAMIMLVILCFAAEKPSGSLLWKVDGNGLSRPSYLLGTHHIAPAYMIDSIHGLREAVAGADTMFVEVVAEDLMSQQAQIRMMQAMTAPADSTIHTVLSPAAAASLDSLMTALTGTPGMAAMLDAYKPAAVSAQLTVLLTATHFPDFNPTAPFDVQVMNLAKNESKPVCGLEGLADQIALLFGDPISVQTRELEDVLKDPESEIAKLVRITDAYTHGDLDAIYEVMKEEKEGSQSGKLSRLTDKRNLRWMERLLPALSSGSSCLVAVGAAHLPGEGGLIDLLRSAGYTVEPLK